VSRGRRASAALRVAARAVIVGSNSAARMSAASARV
jgi:hypothetical protein